MTPRKFLTIIVASLVAGAVLGSFGIANAASGNRVPAPAAVSTAAVTAQSAACTGDCDTCVNKSNCSNGQACATGGQCATGGECATNGQACATGGSCPKTAAAAPAGAAAGSAACGMAGQGAACDSCPSAAPAQ